MYYMQMMFVLLGRGGGGGGHITFDSLCLIVPNVCQRCIFIRIVVHGDNKLMASICISSPEPLSLMNGTSRIYALAWHQV